MLQPDRTDRMPVRVKCDVSAPVARRFTPWTCALVISGMVVATDMAAAQSTLTGALIEFNIPSQPLGTALNRYGDATGRGALYDTSLAAGRVSGDVRGVLAPDEALKKLLSGTGLAAEFVAEHTFVLLPAPTGQQPTPQTRPPEHQRYYGLIQTVFTDALCRSFGARAGRHRFVAVFWIGPDGAVRRSQRIGSTGTLESDQQIDATLLRVRFGEPPPAGFLQPVLILIVPQESGARQWCGKSDPSFHPVEIGP